VSSRRSEDWTQLERDFFAAAPPDVPVAPPEAPRFDDLVGDAPSSRRKRAVTPPRRRAADRSPQATTRPARARIALPKVALAEAVLAKPALAKAAFWAARAMAWVRSRSTDGRRRLGGFVEEARLDLGRRARATWLRLAAEVPGERPDGKTLVAALVVVVVVVVSATVVAPRAAASAYRAPAPATTAR
jgi:hypothetical protein